MTKASPDRMAELGDQNPDTGSTLIERTEAQQDASSVSATITDLRVDVSDLIPANEFGESSSPDAQLKEDDSPVQKRRDSLRRTSSKIANLRAAFEKNDDPLFPADGPKRRFDRSPAKDHEREAEIASLKLKVEQEVELRQAYEEKCISLEKGMEELQTKLDSRESAWKSETEHRDRQLLREKQRAIEEANNAQRQLSDLKRTISTSTRVESQIVSDSTFVQEFDLLYHEVQNFIVNHYRRTKTALNADNLIANFERAAEVMHAPAEVRAVLVKFDSAFKIPIFQAVTAVYTVAIFQEPLLFGLPAEEHWFRTICKAADELPMLLSAAAFNKWRAITLDVVRQSDHIRQSVELAAKEMAEGICSGMDAITGADESQSKIISLTGIVKRAVSLAHMFRVQRAHYEFMLPLPDSPFDPSTMEDVSEDSHPTFASAVRCAMSPAVIKLGDPEGDNVSKLVNVVVKAKVLCFE